MAEKLTDGQLRSLLKAALEKWPLYRRPAYSGASLDVLPPEITVYCPNPKCCHQTHWKRMSGGSKTGYVASVYQCKNCDASAVHFYLYWSDFRDGSSLFFKAGQYPPQEEQIPRTLERALEGSDLEFYRRALRCRNFGYGIGALAYLRRVVENRMNDLLDMIAEEAKQSALEIDVAELERVKSSTVFDEKVGYAALILPPRLRHGGHNPIDLLHDIASEGIHQRSDDECVDIFDQSRTVFEELFAELKAGAARQREFARRLSELQQRKSKK